MKGLRATNPVAIGDIVDFRISDNDETGLITNIHKRKNYVVRKATKLSKLVHVIAANIDQAFLMVTLVLPETSTTFIDRFLVTGEAYRINMKLIFNKTDIYDEALTEYLDYLVNVYEDAGYECYKVSAATKDNIEPLKNVMKNKVSVISGQSGVGKSTLINAIDPNIKLKIGNLSEYHLKGKHTTTYSEMVELACGGSIIDTPGIKGFGLINFKKDEIMHFFPEMLRRLGKCHYYNCTHTHEPKCAVKEAVDNGEIAGSRYNSYIDIFFDEEGKYRAS